MNRVTETNYNDNIIHSDQEIYLLNDIYNVIDTTYSTEEFLKNSSIVESFDE